MDEELASIFVYLKEALGSDISICHVSGKFWYLLDRSFEGNSEFVGNQEYMVVDSTTW